MVMLSWYDTCHSQTFKINNDIKRIVFLGNSITYQGKYIEYIEAYFITHYPDKQFEFINVGLPSETVSGLSEPNHAQGAFPRPDLHERLHRVLSKTKPDMVFSCYGMNDGIYLPFDELRFQKFKEGIHWLHREVIKSGSKIVHITPPIFDERKGKAYANVLDLYSDWLISKRYTDNWNVIDLHWPMRKELESQRLINTDFVLAQDGIHPNNYGHFIMACNILWELDEHLSSASYGFENFLSEYSNRDNILNLVHKKHVLMKDAWLTDIGHKRPRMTIGLPLNEALKQKDSINKAIKLLID
ncbi:SGNH/GDSL hydrolase family protein [Aestuariibaculum sp. TT11]|uniref:SGNH/GDSL hydrolase family protein n=2 Tax=Aestuariibaculum sediminum TaxID=2770637 RepID=A0A8J6PY21_9FLAO|nr:SGNH/GDSL hydrolase family protein [Aestuariibaculum sediminum]